MPVGRTPQKNKQDNAPTMLRAIRIGDDVYAPGEEDEMLEALQAHVDDHNQKAKAAAKAGTPMEELDYNAELHRLELGGSIANFVELDEEEIEHLDTDLRANAQHRAHVQEIQDEGKEGARRMARGGRKGGKVVRSRKGPTQKAGETVDDKGEGGTDDE